MTTLNQVCDFLDQFAPTRLAEDWDNVGLLVGDDSVEVNRIMTCLTVTPASAREAIAKQADLIVSHHPLPFRPIKKLTTDQTPSRLLWELIRGNVAIYSPHTGFDSAAQGINQSVCERIGLQAIAPIIPAVDGTDGLGAGRVGDLSKQLSVGELVEMVKAKFELPQLRFVGDPEATVSRVASACGSGGSFLQPAIKSGCDAFVTGETDFHTCLEAESRGVALLLLGHYSSERFAIEMLAGKMKEQFSSLEIWASEEESDPIVWA